MAGNLASLMASRGRIRAKEMVRTTGTLLWMEFAPAGHARPRSAAPPSARRRPPVLALTLWMCRASRPLRSSGVRRWERILPLMATEFSCVSGGRRGHDGHCQAASRVWIESFRLLAGDGVLEERCVAEVGGGRAAGDVSAQSGESRVRILRAVGEADGVTEDSTGETLRSSICAIRALYCFQAPRACSPSLRFACCLCFLAPLVLRSRTPSLGRL